MQAGPRCVAPLAGVCHALVLLWTLSGPISTIGYREGDTRVDTEDPQAALPNFDCWGDDGIPHEVWADLYDFVRAFEEINNKELGEGSAEHRAALRAAGEKHLSSLLGYLEPEIHERLKLFCPYGEATLRFAVWTACRIMALPATPQEAATWETMSSEEMPGQKPPGLGGEPVRWPSVCANQRVGLGPLLQEPASLATALNSRWMRPLCGLAEFSRPHLRARPADEGVGALALAKMVVKQRYDCRQWKDIPTPSGVPWPKFLQTFTDEDVDGDGYFSGNGLPADWITKTMKYAFAPGQLHNAEQKINECILGFVTIVLEKLHVAQVARTEEYGKLAVGLAGIISGFEGQLDDEMTGSGSDQMDQSTDAMSIYVMSSWPILPMLCTMARGAQADTDSGKHGYQYKPYALDFQPAEILRPSIDRAELTEVRNLPREAHLARLDLAQEPGNSEAYSSILAALRGVLNDWQQGADGAAGAKLVLVGMIWGTRLAHYLPGVLQRAEGFKLHTRYLLFCLDGAALEVCQQAHPRPALCIPGNLQTIYNKYTILAAIIQLGFDTLYLDFDTLLVKDPLPHLLEAAEHAEVLVSRDFGSECLNTGVIYFKAHPDTAEFLVSLLVWLWHHPYEFSQKAFSAFLRHENSTDARFSRLPLEHVPRWEVLDPMNAFVTSAVYNYGVEGWTGSLDGIVVFHFLDGTGGVDPERAIEGKYLNLYDLFYDNPRIDLRNVAVPLWEQDPRIEENFLRSRLPSPPTEIQGCMLMDNPGD